MSKKQIKKKEKVPKIRNAGTMTESAFWSFIRSTLRNKSRWWKPILECKKNNRRKYTGTNKRQKWEYLCNNCKNWYSDKEISIDHISPVGTLKCANDLPQFVENLFCEIDNLQPLCKKCHDAKSIIDNEKTKQK